MLIEKSDYTDDLEAMSLLCHPQVASEVLFTAKLENFDTLKQYDDKTYFKVRPYQIPFLSYEYLLPEDPALSDEQNFQLKIGAGSCYVYCGRKIGKSLVALLIDLLLDTVHNCYDWVTAFSAFDEAHVKTILEPYISVLRVHPFFKLFGARAVGHPEYEVTIPSGHKTKGVNMALSSRSPGSNWESIHAKKMVQDEHQYEIEDVVHKRSQSTSEKGAIERFAGITNFNAESPAGKIFLSQDKRNWLVNFPQTVSPFWSSLAKQKALDDYGGEESVGYKVHVLAQLCANALSLYDMERIKECVKKERYIKHFEISKDTKTIFQNILVLERPKNVDQVYIAADFGITAPTEIVIIYKIGEFYRYEYNITLYGLVPDEQFLVFEYINKQLQGNVLAIDATEQGGRQIYRDWQKKYKEKNLCAVGFNEKLVIDFEKNEDGTLKLIDGKPIPVEEFVIDWSIRRLQTLLYNGRLEIPRDTKLEKQFSAMKASPGKSGKVVYSSTEADHLHAAFQVFAIAEWIKSEFASLQPMTTENWCIGVCGTV
jgi:hypothetical protein